MKNYSKHIYLGTKWKNEVRPYIVNRDNGLCVHCGKPGKIVHHKIWLTPSNVNNPEIVYGEDNLELVCEECHALIHEGTPCAAAGLIFDADGNLIQREAKA